MTPAASLFVPATLAFFGLGAQELFLILLIVLVIFGAAKLPALGAGLGESIKNFKKSVKEGLEEDDDAAAADADHAGPVVKVEVAPPGQLEAGADQASAVAETARQAETKS